MLKILQTIGIIKKDGKFFGFPNKIKDIWLAFNGIEKDKTKWEVDLPYWNKHGEYANYQIGDILKLKKNKNFVGFYKLINKHKYTSWGSDLAGFDDGLHYDFEFSHTSLIKKNTK